MADTQISEARIGELAMELFDDVAKHFDEDARILQAMVVLEIEAADDEDPNVRSQYTLYRTTERRLTARRGLAAQLLDILSR